MSSGIARWIAMFLRHAEFARMSNFVLMRNFESVQNECVNENQAPNSYISQQVESSRLFFLDVDPAFEFAVVFGGFENCGADYRIDRQDFPWFTLEFVSRGTGSLCMGGVKEELRPGSFFLYGPGMPHRIESSASAPLGKYFVGFSGAGVERFLDECEMRPGAISRCLKGELIRRTFDTLIDRGVRKSKWAGPLCGLLTRQLVLMCRDDATDLGDAESLAFATYTRIRDFIGANFMGLRKLSEIADGCGLDAPYLCRLFARFHDETPYQYLTRLRMERASQLLLATDVTVQEVAVQLGFKDPFHFSRVFKSVHHAPPSRFRQSMRR